MEEIPRVHFHDRYNSISWNYSSVKIILIQLIRTVTLKVEMKEYQALDRIYFITFLCCLLCNCVMGKFITIQISLVF